MISKFFTWLWLKTGFCYHLWGEWEKHFGLEIHYCKRCQMSQVKKNGSKWRQQWR